MYKDVSYAECSCFPAALPSNFSRYERSQTGLAWKGPQSSSGSSPCHGQGFTPWTRLLRAPFKLALKVDISTGLVSDPQSSPAEGEEQWGSCRRAVQQWCLLFPSASSKWEAPCWAAWIPSVRSWVWLEQVWFWASAEEKLPLGTDCAASGISCFDSSDPHLQSAVGTRLSPIKLLLRFISSLWDLVSLQTLYGGVGPWKNNNHC